MTYCLAIRTDAGLVFASDSRTNAGVDHVNSYSKMHSFCVPGERAFVVLAAGNLGTTQAVINRVTRDIEDHHARRSLNTIDDLFDAAEYIGELSTDIQARHVKHSGSGNVSFEASFILGGQISGKPHNIILVYPEGNCIAASPTNPFLQIGETKYGKPILDRVITSLTSLSDAARCALVSLDSTMRSNLSVGFPIELSFYEKDHLAVERHLILEEGSPFYKTLKESWGSGLRRAFEGLPRFDWEQTER